MPTCETCIYWEMPRKEGHHCYMFDKEPRPCAQYQEVMGFRDFIGRVRMVKQMWKEAEAKAEAAIPTFYERLLKKEEDIG